MSTTQAPPRPQTRAAIAFLGGVQESDADSEYIQGIADILIAVEREAQQALAAEVSALEGRVTELRGTTEILLMSRLVQDELDVEQFREWVIGITSGYPMDDGEPLGPGGRAFEQCRSRVLDLLDEWQYARLSPHSREAECNRFRHDEHCDH